MNNNDVELSDLKSLNVTKYYAMIPYLVNDMPISVYSKALYMHIVRRCGAKKDGQLGICYETSRHMAQHLHISVGSITKAKRELVKAGLISVKKNPGKHGEFPNDIISVTDIRWENGLFYSTKYFNQEERINRLEKSGIEIRNILKFAIETRVNFLETETKVISTGLIESPVH